MTATVPPRGRTGTRWGRVYGWDVIDHDSWMAGVNEVVLNDYVGQTRQKGRARENQHRDSQPWSDLTVGSPRVLWEGWCTDEELDEQERHFIQDVEPEKRPRLNYLLNDDNPRQIPKWVLERQRHERDALRGDDPWEPTPYRPEVYGYAPAVKRRPWKPWQKRLLGWSIAWLASAVAGWITLDVNFDFAVWWHPAVAGAAMLPGLLLGLWLLLVWTTKPRTRARLYKWLGLR